MSLPRFTFKNATLATLGVAAVGFGAVVAAAADPSPGTPAIQDNPTGYALAAVHGPSSWEHTHLGAFRRARTGADTPPADVIGQGTIRAGADTAQTREVAAVTGSSEGTDQVYVTPAAGGVCIDSASYLYSGCVSDEGLAKGDVESAICSPFLDADKIAVYGLLPDGSSPPLVMRAGLPPVALNVRGGFFSVLIAKREQPITGIQWTNSDGSVRTTNPVPADAYTSACEATDPATATARVKKLIHADAVK